MDEISSYLPYDLISKATNSDLQYITISELGEYIHNHPQSAFYSGYDPAKLVDGAVFFVLEKEPTGKLKPILKKIWRGEKYSEQIAYVVDAVRCGISLHITDKTGVGEKVNEDLERALGSVVAQGLTYTNALKEKLIVNLKSALDDGRLELPDDVSLRAELHGLQKETTANGVHKYHHESGKHDDQVWSLANAVYAAGSGREKIDLLIL